MVTAVSPAELAAEDIVQDIVPSHRLPAQGKAQKACTGPKLSKGRGRTKPRALKAQLAPRQHRAKSTRAQQAPEQSKAEQSQEHEAQLAPQSRTEPRARSSAGSATNAKSGGTQHSKSGPPSPQSSGTAFFEKAAFPYAVEALVYPPLRVNGCGSPQDGVRPL